MHVLLDTYFAALRRAGLNTEASELGGPRTEGEVRAGLDAAGLVEDSEIVGWFTWSAYNGYQSLFWETGMPCSLEDAVQRRDELAGAGWGGSTKDWPGPASWLPILYLDGSEFMSVDLGGGATHGNVFFLFAQGENSLVFTSLGEAIESALFAVESGLWSIKENQVMCPERSVMPYENDRNDPPWTGYHAPFTWILARNGIPQDRLVYVNETGPEPLLFLPHSRIPERPDLITSSKVVPWPVLANHKRTGIRADLLEAGLVSGLWKPLIVEPGSDPLAIVRQSRSRHPRCQVISAPCAERLLALGTRVEPLLSPFFNDRPLEQQLTCDEIADLLQASQG